MKRDVSESALVVTLHSKESDNQPNIGCRSITMPKLCRGVVVTGVDSVLSQVEIISQDC